MTAGIAALVCSICGDPSHDICVYCTKDACINHRCDRCKRCSDCCECDVPLSAAEPMIDAPPAVEAEPVIEAAIAPEEPVLIQEPLPIPDPEMSIFAPETERKEPSEETKSGDVFRP
ncbi:MAG TPA: hypothetical protein VKT81_14805 [Bryobacteraceae bacterium]|nr:hypothetical protein [Bryobacteraceae bacterium]